MNTNIAFLRSHNLELLTLCDDRDFTQVFGGFRVVHLFSFLCCVCPVSCVPGVASFWIVHS